MAEWTIAAVLKEDDHPIPLPWLVHHTYATKMQLSGGYMTIFKRCAAVLVWVVVSLFVGVLFYHLENLKPPYIPEWTILIFFLITATMGGAYIALEMR